MMVLIVKYNGSSNLAEQSRKAASATASVATHVNRYVLVSGIQYQTCQLHEVLLDHIEICLLVPAPLCGAPLLENIDMPTGRIGPDLQNTIIVMSNLKRFGIHKY